MSLSAPAKATAAAPASPGPNPTGLLVVIGLVLLMTTTGLLSVLREANSQHVLYGRDEVAVRYGGPLCASASKSVARHCCAVFAPLNVPVKCAVCALHTTHIAARLGMPTGMVWGGCGSPQRALLELPKPGGPLLEFCRLVSASSKFISHPYPFADPPGG